MPTANPNGWIELTGFPTYGPRTQVTGIAYGAGRFVAVGWSVRNGNTRGRVWTSINGVTWTAQPDAQFAGRSLEAVANDGTNFYAFTAAATTVWKSADGRSWQMVNLPEEQFGELGSANAFSGGHVIEATAAGAYTYAAGGGSLVGGDIVCDGASLWRSANGIDWQLSTVSDSCDGVPYEFEDIAAMGGSSPLVVGIGSDPYFGQGVRYTADFDSWTTPAIDLEGSGYLDVAAGGQRIVGVGYTGDEYEQAIAFVTDGTTWTTRVFDTTAGPAEQLAFAGGKFVAVGGQKRAPGPSWWSSDGLTWNAGPTVPYPAPDPVPPEAGDDPFTHRTMGGGTPGVVLAQTYDNGLHVWFAPLTAFGG